MLLFKRPLIAVGALAVLVFIASFSIEKPDSRSQNDLLVSTDSERNHQLLSTTKLSVEPTYSEIKKYFRTGDVLLFKEFDPSGLGIMLVEHELGHVPGYTHVGIIFKLPPNNGLDSGLYLWQAIPPKDVFPQTYGVDYFKGAASDGAQMVSLDKVMNYLGTLKGLDTEYVSIRQLQKPLTESERASLELYAREVGGRSFSYPAALGMAEDYLKGAAGKQSANNSFFCSKLASQTFSRAGLIDSVVTNSVLPGHFAISPGDEYNKIVFKTNALDSIVEFKPN